MFCWYLQSIRNSENIFLITLGNKSNYIDYDFYIEAKYNTRKLMKPKKIEFFNTKLTENIGKPKELWKSLKLLTNLLTFSKKFFAHLLTTCLLICQPLL